MHWDDSGQTGRQIVPWNAGKPFNPQFQLYSFSDHFILSGLHLKRYCSSPVGDSTKFTCLAAVSSGGVSNTRGDEHCLLCLVCVVVEPKI